MFLFITYKDINSNILLMNQTDTLKICSRCKSTILLKYFSKNRKGCYFKLCDNCRLKRDSASTTHHDAEIINNARSDFIQSVINNGSGRILYLGQVDPDSIGFQHPPLPELSGNELAIEHHSFVLHDSGIPVYIRWRFKQDANISHPIHINTTTQSILSS